MVFFYKSRIDLLLIRSLTTMIATDHLSLSYLVFSVILLKGFFILNWQGIMLHWVLHWLENTLRLYKVKVTGSFSLIWTKCESSMSFILVRSYGYMRKWFRKYLNRIECHLPQNTSNYKNYNSVSFVKELWSP